MVVLACGQGDTSPRTLRLALKTSPNRLDPAFAVDAAEGEICSQLFQGLVRFAPDGKLKGDAAESWEIGGEGHRYVFHLRRDVRFSSGRPVTSRDVVHSFERVLAPSTASPRAWVLDRIRGAREFTAGATDRVQGLTALDDSTVVIELDVAFRPFLSLLAMPAAMITGEADPATDLPGVPAGSGPWRLAAWERGDYLALVPNAYHPFRSRGLDEVRYRVIPEAFTRIAEFESGTLDILEIPTAEVRRYLDDPRWRERLQSRADLRVFYIGLNNSRFRDARVRRAFNMSVDVDQLIAVLAAGEATRSAGSIPPGLPGYRERAPYRHDPEAARRLLAEAGYPQGLDIEIWQRESPEGNRILEAVQGFLAQSGVRATLVRREWSAFKEAVSAGKVDAFLLDWFADYPDAENFLYPLFHSDNVGGGGNRSFFRDAEVDRLIEAAASATDDARAANLYAQADSLVFEKAPWIFLYFPRTFEAISPRISGYHMPTLYLGTDLTTVVRRDD